MKSKLVVERTGTPAARWEFRELRGVLSRLKGLLGTTNRAAPVALVGCSSIHTYGMRYRIDVAFVATDWTVLEVRRAVPPRMVVACRGAWLALERPHQRDDWLHKGEWVRIRRMKTVQEGGCNGTRK